MSEKEPFAEAPESASDKERSAEARKSALESDYAALYAVAGLTDALAEALKGALADTQQKANKRISELQSKRPELSRQARSGAEELRTFVITLPEQFKHLPDTTKARIAELQRQANDLLAQATSTYGDFAWRGKQAVDEVRESARDRSAKATKPVTPRNADMSAASDPSSGMSSESGQASDISPESGMASDNSSESGPAPGM
jgi:chromosome segregation ATPase